ncbi:MAG TPA: NAD-dependent epimerase/dehydratase family protein [Candidatus Dormibacteraeota bacterium]|nr:NAD-dependent epimerase/dehydratase family protein [Candidatus Dormibacteraeota bacterium]
MAQRVLVVGGAGFVGSNLVRRLLAEGVEEVVVIDNLLSAERENVPVDERVRFIEGSIADPEILARLTDDYDYVWHLATYHGNQSSIANPLEDHENNLITTLRLLERVRDFKRLRKLVYAASGCVLAPHTFDDARPVEEDGDAPFDLDSPYQISKIVGEFYCVYFHKQHRVPTVRARFQNVYGPGEILGAGRWRGTAATVWRNVVPTFIYRALRGMPLELDNGGVASRDFIYVDDIVEGLVACALRGQPGDVYNLASGEETTIKELAETVNHLAGGRSEVVITPQRPWDRAGRRVGSTRKSREQLGFEAKTRLAEGLRKTVDWTRANLDLVERAIAKHRDRVGAREQVSAS